MKKEEADKLHEGDVVELRDGSLYHGKKFTIVKNKPGTDFWVLNMIERPIIIKTAHISQFEKEGK